ncbi:MAG: hypothetical protein WCE44_04560 [Candidatus Velthaea sp.]
MSVGSPAGMFTVGNPAFYRFVLRLGDTDAEMSERDRAVLDVLAAVPHASSDEPENSGDGWRIVPAQSFEDWPVLEATPQRLRAAFQTARRVLWQQAAPVGITAGELVTIDADIEAVLSVLHRAEVRGYSVNVSYVS